MSRNPASIPARPVAGGPRWRTLPTLGAILLLAGCGATESITRNQTVHKAAEFVGAAAETPEPQDFVKASRTGRSDFMAVGVTPPARTIQPRKGDDVKKLQGELDATRASHDKIAGRKPPPRPAKPAPARDGKNGSPGPSNAKKKLPDQGSGT